MQDAVMVKMELNFSVTKRNFITSLEAHIISEMLRILSELPKLSVHFPVQELEAGLNFHKNVLVINLKSERGVQ